MDQVNRDVSMKMLIDTARASTSRQFVFITPQGVGSVTSCDDVKIIKLVKMLSLILFPTDFDRMNDPERGQTTLSYGT